MERKPFTLEQAARIAADFQHLVGQNLTENSNDYRTQISYVAVGPFIKNDLGIFIYNHHMYSGLSNYEYTNPEQQYDVYLIAYEGDNAYEKDIRTFATERNIKYPFSQFH